MIFCHFTKSIFYKYLRGIRDVLINGYCNLVPVFSWRLLLGHWIFRAIHRRFRKDGNEYCHLLHELNLLIISCNYILNIYKN